MRLLHSIKVKFSDNIQMYDFVSIWHETKTNNKWKVASKRWKNLGVTNHCIFVTGTLQQNISQTNSVCMWYFCLFHSKVTVDLTLLMNWNNVSRATKFEVLSETLCGDVLICKTKTKTKEKKNCDMNISYLVVSEVFFV